MILFFFKLELYLDGLVPVEGLPDILDRPGKSSAVLAGTEPMVELGVDTQAFHRTLAHLAEHQAHVRHIVRESGFLPLHL